MRSYLFDTTIVTALVNRRTGIVAIADPWIATGQAAISALVYAEVMEYIKPSQRFPQNYHNLQLLLARMTMYYPTIPILERYADIRLSLRRGRLIGDFDTLIAATALEYDLTIVTRDPDFQRVPGLKIALLTREQLL